MRAQTWWCGDREKPTRVGQNGFCIVCGTGLGPCGTEQARCDVRPDPHDGLTPYDIARNASASIRLAIAAQSSELAITYAENAEGHVQRLMELAALSQSALAPAEWLADEVAGACEHCSLKPGGGDWCVAVRDMAMCKRMRLAAALAATGAAAESSAEEMLDALQSWADEHNQSISVYRGFARATRTDPAGTLPAFTRSNICDLAKALIAQAGGADRG